jgi:hypothetical protein
MFAFHNDAGMKSTILAGLATHRAADEIVQGRYWENGKGCAVGCTLESIRRMKGIENIDHSSHRTAEKETGIPQILWRLEDRIFEGLPNELAKDWPEQFTSAIRPGADLTMIWPRFALWILKEELSQYVTKRPGTAAAIAEVADLYQEWSDTCKNPTAERWLKVRKTAYAAAYAYAAADAAAYAAADAAAAAYAYAAADAAAYAAAYASRASLARQAAYQRQAEKLIELLKAA